MTAAEPGGVAGRSNSVSRPAVTRAEPVSASATRAADAAVTAMYAAHYRSLVGLAVLLVRNGNADTAQQVVQDSFVALHRNWRGLADGDGSGDRALLYLWQRVVNRSRSAGRQPASGDTPGNAVGEPALGDAVAEPALGDAAAEPALGDAAAGPALGDAAAGPALGDAAAGPAPGAVLAAMHALPQRQREALVLQHYAGLSTAQTAQMLGISAGAVQRHTARAMSSLHGVLDRAP
jgi:DNA-directed RNA polymerase specialized sigma24 family protein